MIEALGWGSSVVLLVTVSWQVVRQWREGPAEGVSIWLFIGQFAASIGFAGCSWLKRDWVFLTTNGTLAVAAAIGIFVTLSRKGGKRKS